MKRFTVLIALLLCAMMMFSAYAVETAPGETVSVSISVGASNAHQIKLYITFDTNVFECVGINSSIGNASFNSAANRGVISMYDMYNPISAGQVGSITLKVKDSAKSGTYPVSVSVAEAFDTDYNDTTVSAYAGSVTVVAVCMHDETEEKVIKEADCENTGTKQIVCKDCGEIVDTQTVDKLNHKFGEWKETKAATCTEEGRETAKCERCDETQSRKTDKLNHKFGEWTETKAATCTEDGEETSKCERCDEVQTRKTDKLNHKFGEWTETKAATCTEDGEETSKCVRCDEVQTRKTDKLNHKFGEWTETKAATCMEDGEETSRCERCDEVQTRKTDKLNHKFGEWTETKAATCTEDGEETSKCVRCDEVKARAIKALGHAFGKWTVTKQATCTQKGEECSECSRCNEKQTREVKALGHNAVWKTIKPATTEEEGLKQKVCKRCNEVLEEKAIPVLKNVVKNACTAGIRISELAPAVHEYDAWKMVTPIDLRAEGVTRYPLIAGNVYEIGYVEVTVANGAVSAELVVEADVDMYSAAMILLKDISEYTRFSASAYDHYEFPVSIDLSDLPADRMFMMVACRLTIDQAKPEPKYYNFISAEHKALVEQLNEIIK